MIPVGIVGGSGFTGAELLRLCASHPEFSVQFATGDSQAGALVADLYPSLAAAYRGTQFVPWDPALLDGVEVLFVALPHGKSQELMDSVLGRVKVVVDLGADFRLPDPAVYETWYHEPHTRRAAFLHDALRLRVVRGQRFLGEDASNAAAAFEHRLDHGGLHIGRHRDIDDLDSRVVEQAAVIVVGLRNRVAGGDLRGCLVSPGGDRDRVQARSSIGDEMAVGHDEAGTDAPDPHAAIPWQRRQVIDLDCRHGGLGSTRTTRSLTIRRPPLAAL